MRNNYFYSFLLLFFLFSFTNEVKSQSLGSKKIHITIENIPKIQHKITQKVGRYTMTRTDKSPTATYRIKNDFTNYSLDVNDAQEKISTTLDHDFIILKLRYNPGKTQSFILRRGDDAYIEYSNGKPYLDVRNREVKEHDQNVLAFLKESGLPPTAMEFYHENNRSKNNDDKKKSFKKYDQLISSLDSLFKDNSLSDAEYDYYRKYLLYRKELDAEKFNTELFKNPDLHVEGYDLFMRQYIFGNLKKKIISLGNGSARNSLEAFDFALTSKNFTRSNKKHLLSLYLKGIKIDFPTSTYKDRVAKYESFLSEKDDDSSKRNSKSLASVFNTNNENSKLLKSIYNTTNEVELVDSKGNSTTLQEVLDSHKGKIVYIDFWASWCAPCRDAFPSYAELKKRYNEKDIVFIFISGDRDPGKWKKAEIEEKLTNSYLASNYPEAKFYKDLDLRAFPRYLIFNKKGQLIKQRALGPDSDNITLFLDEYLK